MKSAACARLWKCDRSRWSGPLWNHTCRANLLSDISRVAFGCALVACIEFSRRRSNHPLDLTPALNGGSGVRWDL